MKTPTEMQQDIINYSGSLVVLAKPGSGKTFTIAEKIKYILRNSLDYQGVIAISFTNKSSKELKSRVLNGGTESKESFFGTISSFYLNEIIYKFAYFIFGKASKEVLVYSPTDNIQQVKIMDEIYRSNDNLLITEDMLPFLGTCFQNGIISLTLVDAIALHVFENCEECRNYIKAKYTHVFIDEYQDCGYLQDRLFLALINLGVIGIAVGDKDQAIYGFAAKDSKYLIGLPKEHGIKTFLLDRNFRCHPQIRDYALRLLDGVTEPETKDCRVIRLACKGNELNIAKAIDMFVQLFRDKKIIEHNSQVAILTRSERTGGMISHNLKEKNIFFKKTPLDEDSSRQGLIFKEMLIAILGKDHEIFGLCNSYISIDDDKKRYDYAYTVLMKLRKKGMIEISLNEFVEASYLFIPYEQKNEKSIEKLEEVVGTEDYWITYTPQDKDSVQIMTLHKSKGLEFKVVFHLDLYRYIMPREQFNPNRYIDMEETINLHYVGITRAEEYSFLVTSEHRTNSQGSVTSGIESPLLSMHNLSSYTTPAKDLYNFLDSEDPRL